MVSVKDSDIFLFWIDKYKGNYRSGVSHGSTDGNTTLCKKIIKELFWDGGYTTMEDFEVECKNCQKAINKLNKPKNNFILHTTL